MVVVVFSLRWEVCRRCRKGELVVRVKLRISRRQRRRTRMR